MKEKRFGSLIIKHRKSAVFFERDADLKNTEMYKPYLQWGDGKETIRGEEIPHYKRSELDRRFDLPIDERKGFYEYLLQIGKEAWVNFEPKVADSMGADYDWHISSWLLILAILIAMSYGFLLGHFIVCTI